MFVLFTSAFLMAAIVTKSIYFFACLDLELDLELDLMAFLGGFVILGKWLKERGSGVPVGEAWLVPPFDGEMWGFEIESVAEAEEGIAEESDVLLGRLDMGGGRASRRKAEMDEFKGWAVVVIVFESV